MDVTECVRATVEAQWRASVGRVPLHRSLRYFLLPIDFTRAVEIPALLELSGIAARTDESLRILDISSPQALPSALCRMSPRWHVTYGNPFEPERRNLQERAGLLGLKNLEIVSLDVRERSEVALLAESFDYVFSCSVFEHIHPQEDGDLVAAANLARLLRAGGRATLSVPYANEAFSEYTQGGAYVESRESPELVFFQRFYDAARLDRLVAATGLEDDGRRFVGERDPSTLDPHDRIASRLGTGWRRILLGRRFWSQAHRHLTSAVEDPDQLAKPYLAFVRLSAPA